MITWIVRIVMFLASVLTGWFVAHDATNFGVIQMVVSLLLITLFLAIAAFLPTLVAPFVHRRKPEERTRFQKGRRQTSSR